VKAILWSGGYLAEQFKPMLLLLVPFALLFAQMEMRLGLRPSTSARRSWSPSRSTGAVPGLDVASSCRRRRPRGAVREPSQSASSSRSCRDGGLPAALPHRQRGRSRLSTPATCPGCRGLAVGRPTSGTSCLTSEPGFSSASAFQRISYALPVRPLPFLGLDLSFGSEAGMMLVFLVLTIVVAFALKDVFGVTI
jgi:hypothetical protein